MSTPYFRFTKLFLAPIVVAGAMLAGGCGGPLSVTAGAYDPSAVDAAEKAKVDQAEAAAADAKKRSDEATSSIDVAKERAYAADKDVEDNEGALEIAKAALDLEETKSSAGKGGQVAAAKADVTAKQRDLEIAEAQKDLAKIEISHSEAAAEEAEKAWLVALAELELAKHVATKGKGPDHEKLKADLEQQVAELREKRADAQKDLNESNGDVADAQAGLNRAKSGG